MRSDLIVVATPLLDDDPGLAERIEDLPVQQFVTHAGVEALDVSVLPRAPGRDVRGRSANTSDPLLDSLGNELWAIV